ncbi:uncharacterized protein METZ01_LOCUS14408 [marine metagenome]|uniref:Uncharacterized protein n=1 Tax=marine metagenome TaxID=408172 RepID=A0A381P4R1_9ZZZZ
MRTCTEDLLTIRDGEPVDADVHSQVLADPESLEELERLRAVRKALQELPELQPPPEVWTKILTEVQRDDRIGPKLLRHWSLGSAIAAGVAMLAFILIPTDPEIPVQMEPGLVVAVPEGDGGGLDAVPAEEFGYALLAAESAQLERELNSIEYQPSLTSADTATIVVVLEDRIGYVDEQLTYASANGIDSRQTEILWRERVDLMNTLVDVRYAQFQQAGF